MDKNFLGGITKKQFIEKYWNKKPLLIKNAVKNISDYAEFEDFISMASDSEFETRMVIEKGGDYPWQAKPGPFKKTDFKKNALWTLVCHNLELLNSDFFELKKNVNFVPDWHFDDIMATISKKGASVGAHIDDYSVFILQGKGKRRWLLEENPNPEYVPDIDIKLLKKFNPKIEWVLEPGDMIYIPPQVAHHGISLEDSISYSLGFKSIRYEQFLQYHFGRLLESFEDKSFHDSKMPLQDDHFELKKYVIDAVYNDIKKELLDKNNFEKNLFKYLSRTKTIIEKNESITDKEIALNFKNLIPFKRDMWAKLVTMPINKTKTLIAINLEIYEINFSTLKKLEELFSLDPNEEIIVKASDLKNLEFKNIIFQLIKDGIFYFEMN